MDCISVEAVDCVELHIFNSLKDLLASGIVFEIELMRHWLTYLYICFVKIFHEEGTVVEYCNYERSEHRI